MKKLIITSILATLLTAGTTLMAQDYPKEYLGLPGDNLNLYAVMNLFQQSETLEGFEKTLNDENSRINNLDLNGDNFVDYIMVKDYVDGDVHTIVLQVALNQYEKQDVAVFTVQRFRNGSVQVQLIGDEALYGRNYIIEPIYDDISGGTPNPGYIGRSRNYNNINVVRTTYYEVASWPMIRFIYRPNYVIWHSSWYWGYYPSYWHPWSPSYWDYYYGYHYNWYPDYYRHYRHWQQPRYTRYNDFYYSSIRSHSPQVSNRIQQGSYKTTYSHPEQRRDGEALYAKTHSGQSSRITDNKAISQGRRSVSGSTRERTTEGTSMNNSRRPSTTNTDRSSTNPNSGKNAGASGRTTTNNTYGSRTNPSSDQNAGNNRRTTTNNTNGSRTNPSSDQNAGVTRRSTTNNTYGSRTNPSSDQNAGVNRRSTTNNTYGSRTNPSSDPNAGVSRRSTTATQRGRINPSSEPNAGTARKSTTTAPARTFSKPEQNQRRETVVKSRQSETTVRSSGQKSQRSDKRDTAVRKNDKTQKSETRKSSSR